MSNFMNEYKNEAVNLITRTDEEAKDVHCARPEYITDAIVAVVTASVSNIYDYKQSTNVLKLLTAFMDSIYRIGYKHGKEQAELYNNIGKG